MIRRYIVTLALGLLVHGPQAKAQSNILACDVLDAALVSQIVGVRMDLVQVASRKESNMGDFLFSPCLFKGPGNVLVPVGLYTYPTAQAAAQAYAVTRAGPKEPIPGMPPHPPVVDEPAVGDKAFWSESPPVVILLHVLKGRRHLTLQVEFRDATAGSKPATGLKERSRPVLQAAMRKL